MPRYSKRTKLAPEDVEQLLDEHRTKARHHALGQLQKCLDLHLLGSTEIEGCLSEISRAMGMQTESQATDVEDGSASPPKTVSKAASKHEEVEEHNEVCEVCEREGDLVCCDTCPLVFHLQCIRPKIPTVPKGDWSCSFCVLEGTADGDKAKSKQAIRAMGRLTRGVDSDDDEADHPALRLAKTGEITIVQAGRKFVVRRTARKQIVELGRYMTLEEALNSVSSVQAAKQSGKGPQQRVADPDEDLWCAHCLDDPHTTVCAFCGCKACYGKFDSNLLILCDDCERETHSYCLHPPLASVPSADPWYCETCAPPPPKKEEPVVVAPVEEVKPTPTIVPEPPIVPAPTPSRGRGRPPGSGKRFKEQVPVNEHMTRRAAGTSIGNSSAFGKPEKIPRKAKAQRERYGSEGSDTSTKREEVVSLEDLMGHIDQASVRMFSDEDMEAFEYHNVWASIPDLQIVRQALLKQQQIITEQLQASDPDFVFSDMTDVSMLLKEDLEMDYDQDDILTHKSRRSDQSSLADITGFPELCSVSQDQPMEEDHSFMMHSTSPDMLLGFTDHDDLHALLDDPHPA